MKSAPRVGPEYEQAEYLQFTAGTATRFAMRLIGILTWPITLPLALLSRISDIVFRSCSEMLALVPYFPGVIMRYEFYRFSLSRCGRNVVIESGAVFLYRDVSVGSNSLVGRYCVVHHCDIGDYVLIGERCTLLSGSRQHSADRTDVPMALQGGQKKRIRIDSDCWIGSHSVVMDNVCSGSIVAAATIVTTEVAEQTIVAGAPAKVIGIRSPSS